MNWRYVDNPYKEYKTIYRKEKGEIVAMAVLSKFGSHAKVVDFLWDTTNKSEPEATLSFIKKYLSQCDFLKIMFWTTHKGLRKSLMNVSFKERLETPRFSAYSLNTEFLPFKGDKVAFVEGDGDSEYL